MKYSVLWSDNHNIPRESQVQAERRLCTDTEIVNFSLPGGKWDQGASSMIPQSSVLNPFTESKQV